MQKYAESKVTFPLPSKYENITSGALILEGSSVLLVRYTCKYSNDLCEHTLGSCNLLHALLVWISDCKSLRMVRVFLVTARFFIKWFWCSLVYWLSISCILPPVRFCYKQYSAFIHAPWRQTNTQTSHYVVVPHSCSASTLVMSRSDVYTGWWCVSLLMILLRHILWEASMDVHYLKHTSFWKLQRNWKWMWWEYGKKIHYPITPTK